MAVDVAEVAKTVDERAAWELYWALSNRFGWAGIMFERSSMEAWEDERQDTGPITDQEFAAVRATMIWDEGMKLIAARAAHEWLPRVERDPDGSFQVIGGDG